MPLGATLPDSDAPPATGLKRALVLSTSTSLIVPLAGLASAPILAHALGTAGRGEVAAAVAPGLLLAGAVTLGLPEALTYLVAKRPAQTRAGLGRAALLSLIVGVIGLGTAYLALPYLADGDRELGQLIALATVFALPQLLVGLLRGAAAGRQLWSAVAAERMINAILRVAALAALALTDTLTVTSAVLVTVIVPILAALPYAPLLRASTDSTTDVPTGSATDASTGSAHGVTTRQLVGFGSRMWVGAVAAIALARIGQVLFLPLSDADQLGLFAVAITISDTPLIVALAIRDALYGVSSARPDPEQVATTSRISLLVGAIGCLVLGASLPWWIEIVFGPGFGAAVAATEVLLACSVINIPGFVAAAGLAAWGRPGLRSLGLALTLAVNLPAFVLLVPTFGALGGALAGLASSTVSTIFMLIATSRVIGLPVGAFIRPTGADLRRLTALIPWPRRNRSRSKR